MYTTSLSLLEQLRQSDAQEAWTRFVQLYTPLLSHWARRLGLRGHDAADLVQEVFTLLVQRMPSFRYDRRRRFRGWLWTLTLNKCREKQRTKAAAAARAGVGDVPDTAVPDHTVEFDEAEYREFLVKRALELMQADFQPDTWKAFWLYVVQDRPPAEVALELEIGLHSVYAAKSRVLRRLRQQLQGLLD